MWFKTSGHAAVRIQMSTVPGQRAEYNTLSPACLVRSKLNMVQPEIRKKQNKATIIAARGNANGTRKFTSKSGKFCRISLGTV